MRQPCNRREFLKGLTSAGLGLGDRQDPAAAAAAELGEGGGGVADDGDRGIEAAVLHALGALRLVQVFGREVAAGLEAVGAHVANKTKVTLLKRIFALFLLLIAFRMLLF